MVTEDPRAEWNVRAESRTSADLYFPFLMPRSDAHPYTMNSLLLVCNYPHDRYRCHTWSAARVMDASFS